MSDPAIPKLGITQNDVAAAEKWILNIGGMLPVVRGMTSSWRATLAGIEVLYGVATALYKLGEATIHCMDAQKRSSDLDKSYKQLVYVAHGVANFVRSEVEQSWYLPATVACLLWDLKGMRFKYPKEEGAGRPLTMEMVTQNVEWLRNRVQGVFNTMA